MISIYLVLGMHLSGKHLDGQWKARFATGGNNLDVRRI